MSKRIDLRKENLKSVAPPAYQITCSWCGALIRSTTVDMPEQMCLICHARMLNDYFQRVKKRATDFRR